MPRRGGGIGLGAEIDNRDLRSILSLNVPVHCGVTSPPRMSYLSPIPRVDGILLAKMISEFSFTRSYGLPRICGDLLRQTSVFRFRGLGSS